MGPHTTSPVRTQQTLNILYISPCRISLIMVKHPGEGLELHNLKLGPSFVIPLHDIFYITATPFSLISVSLDLYSVAVQLSCDSVFVSSSRPSDGGKVPWKLLDLDACTIVNSELSFIQYETSLFHFRLP